MRAIYGFWLVLAAIMSPSCSGADDAPDYRYRLTVEVETPDGVKSGSSVIEVTQRLVRPGSNLSSVGVERRARGEAVAVDLPDGQTLFALLRSEDTVDWATYILPWIAPEVRGEDFVEQLDNPLTLEGEVELPPLLPVSNLGERSGYPMLVTFGDLDDPTSVERVDPDDLAATIGEGMILKRITAQITNDPVTTGIEEKLRWLPDQKQGMLDGRINNTLKAENRLANDLSRWDFSQGLLP
ncbi:MAG: hypothetical protein AAGL68_03375 [Pseudomonadota bacterium]